MSNLYSNLEKDFYFASLNPSRINDELQTTLKKEEGLVQGTRNLKPFVDSEMEKVETGGDGDSEAKVVKMECILLKPKRKMTKESGDVGNQDHFVPEDSHFSKMKQKSMNLFRRFCFQHGILQRVDVDESGDSAFGWQRSGGHEERKGSETVGGNNDDTGIKESKAQAGAGGRRKSRKKLKSEDVRASGGGGGKRPTHVSSSSEPDPFFSSATATEDNEPSRTSTDVNISSSASAAPPSGKARRSHHKKKRKIQSVEVIEANEGKEPVDVEEQPKKFSSMDEHDDLGTKKRKKSRTHRKSRKSKRETEGEIEMDIGIGETELDVDRGASFSANFMETENTKEEDKVTAKKVSLRKPRKHGKIPRRHLDGRSREHAKSEAFSIGNLSQVEMAHKLHKQRDSEWLEWSSTEDDEVDEPSKPDEKVERPIQQDLQAFMNSTMALAKINSILGLDPFTKVVRNNQCVQVKWVPWSRKYIAVCSNALLFFITTLSVFCSLITILEYDTPLSSTRKIIKIDFIHHLIESLFLMLLTLFLTIWAASCILELGTHYGEFYSRFNMGICLLKYDAKAGIHEMIVKHLGCIFMFDLLLLLLFFQGFAHTSSIVRESCGFLGYSILRPFNMELRESIYYPLVEIFGLGLFLYCFLCVNVVLLQLAVVAKALGNMAKEFNLRMGYALGTLSLEQEEGSSKRFKKVIPFKKLLAEHQIITSLFRNIGHVNSIVFGAFIFAMICEIGLVMWLFFDVFLEEHPRYLEGVSIDRAGNAQLAVPLRLQKNEGERLLKAFVIFAITWLMYWIFGGVLHNAGDACNRGMEFVRRYGLTLCKNSKQRRFILSMINSFSPKNPYWIGRKFKFSRATFVALTNFVIGASMVTIAFRPDRISLTSIELCNENGNCQLIQVYKTAQHILYSTLDAEPPQRKPEPPIGVLPPAGPPWESEIDRYNSFLNAPPCTSQGSYPLILSVVADTVYTEWPYPYTQLRLPFLYQRKTVEDPSTSPPKEYILFEPQTIYMPSKLVEPFKDCYGKSISYNPPETDDCKNPSLDTPKRHDLTVKVPAPPKKQLIAINQIPGYPKSDPRFFCCYKYGISSYIEVQVCNMPSKTAIDSNCSLSAEKSPSVSPFIKALTERRDLIEFRDDLASEVPYSDPIRVLWTNCLCKGSVPACKKAFAASAPPPATSAPPRTPPPHITFTIPVPPAVTPPLPTTSPTCFKLPETPDEKKYFTECRVERTDEGWANLQYILYPTVFQKESTFMVQKLPIKEDCFPPSDMPLPTDTSEIMYSTSTVYDCHKDSISFFVDECKNPILYLDSGVTRWKDRYVIRVVNFDYKRVVCCVDYQLKDPLQSRRQALVCNNPNEFISKCGTESDNIRRTLTHTYFNRLWEFKTDEVKQSEFESDYEIVACMCQPVPYVKKMYRPINPDHMCRSKLKGGKVEKSAYVEILTWVRYIIGGYDFFWVHTYQCKQRKNRSRLLLSYPCQNSNISGLPLYHLLVWRDTYLLHEKL